MIRLTLPLVSLSLIGCAPETPGYQVPPPETQQATPCGAEKLARFIGVARTDAISAEVASISGAKAIRWIAPGMAVTMDFREDRLNVRLDEKSVITTFVCG